MFKKTPVLLLALAISVSLAACKKTDETPSESLNPSADSRPSEPSVPTSSPENVGQANQANPSPSESITAAPTTAALDASIIFKQNCIACHGAELEGRMIGPNLQKVGARLSKEKIINQITNGNTMPPFKDKLNKQEIETLASWLAAKK
ncbi:cytochrome c551 [Paenibacillus sp. V4I3]|uniref:c-type cytochrome n=1 Tax=unclassified Paenibacillus TaxID=185978 RepID=UPI00277DC0A9|nr:MULTISPECIES: cytochrome c [unclassified Paenibacillus]MDQ0874390.1 cytochrome c551 [Paenibacillus sp. V4I3]MDQ0889893.1 cytochrome c551 [Paenibacillus sp. V4I9]